MAKKGTGKVTIKDKGWNAIKAEMKKLKDMYTTVGVHEDAGQHTSDGLGTISMAQLAAVHEYGTDIKNGFGRGIHIVIPERSFMRTSISESAQERNDLITKLVGKIIDLKLTPMQALGQMGEFAVNKMKKRILNGPFIPLRPRTIKAKGSSKPLIDTGQLIGSITHKEKSGRIPAEG